MPVQLLNDFHIKKLLEISSEQSFNEMALQLFLFQSKNVEIYREYLVALGCNPEEITRVEDIPFLPISFFKSHQVSTSCKLAELVFESSGTSGQSVSRHYVRDASLYTEIARAGFERRYGPIEQYSILGLLPSYLERSNSSLVFMVKEFMDYSREEVKGFYLDEFDHLKKALKINQSKSIPTVLFGVTFALIDFAESHGFSFEDLIIIETGGTKGRRMEITRHEVHDILKKSFGLNQVHSEYGMTELLSQAYSKNDCIFESPPWMKVFVRDLNDPFSLVKTGKSGGLNIIDLANLHSCAFIATDDLGILRANDRFEVLGRIDYSDIRGCSLMVD